MHAAVGRWNESVRAPRPGGRLVVLGVKAARSALMVPLDRAAEAHEHLEPGRIFVKCVLTHD